jgi:hypothetical protein
LEAYDQFQTGLVSSPHALTVSSQGTPAPQWTTVPVAIFTLRQAGTFSFATNVT